MIEWLSKEDFWKIFDREYKPNKRYLNEIGYFECEREDLEKIAQTKGVETPSDEGDFPGPVLRWYSRINGHLALVTHHYGCQSPITNVDFEDDMDDEVRYIMQDEFKQMGFKLETT